MPDEFDANTRSRTDMQQSNAVNGPEYSTKFLEEYRMKVLKFFEQARKDPDQTWQNYFAAIQPAMIGLLNITEDPITPESVEKFKEIVAVQSQNSAQGTTTENPPVDATS